MPGEAPIEGGCLCGGIRYRITGSPRISTLCHCRSCRRAAGAPTLAWISLSRSDFQITSGAPARFNSSPGIVRQFCPTCGTQLSWEEIAAPDVIDITTASLDTPEAFPPAKEIWLDHRIPWESTNGPALRFARSSKGAAPLP
ncbi:MAG TPA: GFA family protein [Hyphomonadaceae bacterium]|jgi:hypothetical protein|nr:GFA family protein [Hyphomonadaceae bacterium]